MRFALYYSPNQDSRFHVSGATWLGRDAFTGSSLMQPGNGLLADKTQTPARYGFHATLKAPFQLHQYSSYDELEDTAGILAETLGGVTINKLVLREIDGFLALVPDIQEDALSHLANVCVTALDPLRKPADQAEKERRKSQGLTPRQIEHLETWGYPYVFEEFRFHITLTERLTAEAMPDVRALAADHFAEFIGRPLDISCVTIFEETAPSSPFIIKKQFPLRATHWTSAA